MKNIQAWFAWVTTISLAGAPVGLEGCGSKGKAPLEVAQQAPNSTVQPATPATTASYQTPAPPQTDQPQPNSQQSSQVRSTDQMQPAAQNAQMELPDVNLTPQGLDELLAPIALYPDPVLAVITQASVDPQEVMDGGNWLVQDQNRNLKEAALDEATKKAGFTPVMQALLHYSTVVDMMCQQFDWTKQLGAAYQANPKAVLDSVQRLRAVAVDNGALKTSSQMKVEVKQDQGQQVVQLQPANPKVVYIPQYDPTRVYSTTTTTTGPDGSSTTTTTTSSPAASSSTTVVQQQSSGVSTSTAVIASLLSFGVGIAVGAAISNNNYYYPSWGYGGIYYGGRPYYPPPYRPYYGGGWGPSYGYHRPPYYQNNTVIINNNYYNRFNNNANLKPNYRPMPVHYNNKPNGVYANSMGNRPGANTGVTYNRPNNGSRPATQPASPQTRPGNAGNINQPRPNNPGNNVRPANPGNPAQRPAPGNNGNNWKGQNTYQGTKPGANSPNFGNRPVDRGYGQSGAARPSNGVGSPPTRPANGKQPGTRPATGNMQPTRPATQPAARPSPQPAARPAPSSGGAFGGASSGSADRSASNRGRASMGAPREKSSGGAKQSSVPARKRN